jgi:hypothetical protein
MAPPGRRAHANIIAAKETPFQRLLSCAEHCCRSQGSFSQMQSDEEGSIVETQRSKLRVWFCVFALK